jgi:hypothetical protein
MASLLIEIPEFSRHWRLEDLIAEKMRSGAGRGIEAFWDIKPLYANPIVRLYHINAFFARQRKDR